MSVPLITLNAIRRAADTRTSGPGRKALFPNKRTFLHYLTPTAQGRLVDLAKTAGISQSDFLEVLVGRYGDRAARDILAALGGKP